MSNVIDLTAFRQARSVQREERAANYRHCLEVAQPQARKGAFEPLKAPPPEPPEEEEEDAEPLEEITKVVWRTSARGGGCVSNTTGGMLAS
jgi:hypothetical protein